MRQLLTESMVLSALGGAAGIALAYVLTRGLIALDPLKIPRVQDIAIDGRVLAFTAAIALVTGVLFGIVPAIQSSRADLQPVLKEGGRDSRVATGWLRRALVVGEVAASVVLVAAALLLARSFARLLDVDAGFNPAHVTDAAHVAAGADLHRRPPRWCARTPRSGRRLRESPGVQAAGARHRTAAREHARRLGHPHRRTPGGQSAVNSPPTGRSSPPATSRRIGTPLRDGPHVHRRRHAPTRCR